LPSGIERIISRERATHTHPTIEASKNDDRAPARAERRFALPQSTLRC